MTQALFLLVCLFAASARADLSDSGNLAIGGQTVIVGTVTVQGNAFSVGTSTLTATGGQVGIGTGGPAYPLDVVGYNSSNYGTARFLSNNISSPLAIFVGRTGSEFIHGVSAGAGQFINSSVGGDIFYRSGGGNMIWTGDSSGVRTDIYLKSTGLLGIGTSSPCSTCTLHVAGNASVTGTLQAAALLGDGSGITGVGAHILVASASVTGVTATTFTVTSTAGKVYYAVWKATQNAATGDFGITFNGDTSANYAYFGRCDNSGGGSAMPAGMTGTQIYFDEQTSNRLTAQSVHRGSASIYMDPNGTNQPAVEGVSMIRLGSGETWVRCGLGGYWKSNTAVTSIELRVNAGNYTGQVYLYSGEAYP